MKQTLYDILGVAQDCSFEDIEIAYARRFAILRSETSWDSNRLVMLNEAREVLSDVGRRAAYDASLAVVPARARAHGQETETDETARSNGKWYIALAVLAALVIWLVMRDDATSPGAPTARSGDVPGTSGTPGQPGPGGDETAIEVELLPADEEPTNSPAPAVAAQTDAQDADSSGLAPGVTNEPEATPQEPVSAAIPLIVGNWNCFDPVTGRSSTYGFTADGRLVTRQSGGQTQTFSYEVAGGRVMLLNVDPPSSMGIGELGANKLILNASAEGRRIVCSR